ncbi:MAG: hypothetical protein ACJ76N_10960 [Thermoanaerobaculia bacterium]
MLFNLEITITGICAFVADDRGAGPVCVVMPSTDIDRNSLDDEFLCPHVSYIEQGYGFLSTKTPLKRYRVSFHITERGTVNPPITSIQAADINTVGLLDIAKSGINNITDQAMVSGKPPETVATQVILRKGSVGFTSDGRSWDFNPAGQGVLAAHEVIVKINGLESAEAILTPFDAGQSTTINLKPPEGISTVALKIVNTCARKVAPQQEAKRDRDFKWYYELLDQNHPGPISLGNGDLLIPRMVSMQFIGGNNCFPSLLPDARIG